MSNIAQLVSDIANARYAFIQQIRNIPQEKAQWKPDAETWSVVDNTEHLFWAEHGAIAGMWKTLHAIRSGEREREYESVHKNLPVEEIIALTWQPKEKVPPVAAPRFGGPLNFWILSFEGLQKLLEVFASDLKDDELRLLAHPHPISGPMDFHQRLEFLRFHIDRHFGQVKTLVESINNNG
ncbi:DinB family protein [Pollutibacter soli]|uniref:DinB family protein n=1 Tax=Pollutibacter soli TaxID=3034157 RepID=UPI0030133F51